MPNYVEGFVVPVPKGKLKAYFRIARAACKVWRDHGALDYQECLGVDLKAPFAMTFPKGIRSKPGEAVLFSYIVYKSKAQRDRVMKKVMTDKRMTAICDGGNMPFDCKRMLYGGFKAVVSL